MIYADDPVLKRGCCGLGDTEKVVKVFERLTGKITEKPITVKHEIEAPQVSTGTVIAIGAGILGAILLLRK